MFYTINTWSPRKRLAALLDGFVRSFRQEDRVALIVKTSREALFDDPASPARDRSASRVAAAIIARAADQVGRPPPRIAVIADDDLADNFIDGLHTLGHCFVSLSRSEGFGLGGFDAAAHGRPVIAVGYGGPVDYLGADWRGRVPHRMAPAENLSGYEWFEDGRPFLARARRCGGFCVDAGLRGGSRAIPRRSRSHVYPHPQRVRRRSGRAAPVGRLGPSRMSPRILIATPVKDATPHLDTHFGLFDRLRYPRARITLAYLESDSQDGTLEALRARLAQMGRRYRRCRLLKQDMGFHLPPGMSRWTHEIQLVRRAALARSRNHLLSRALDDEDWVLWLDVDVIDAAPDLIHRLLATGKDIVHPHCVLTPAVQRMIATPGATTGACCSRPARPGPAGAARYGGRDSSDDPRGHPPRGPHLSALPLWRGTQAGPQSRPWATFGRRGEIETEGLGLMAWDMGYLCWGMPDYEVIHAPT